MGVQFVSDGDRSRHGGGVRACRSGGVTGFGSAAGKFRFGAGAGARSPVTRTRSG